MAEMTDELKPVAYDQYQKEGDEAVEKSRTRLLEIFNRTMPNLDFDKIFAPYLKQQQEQPTMKAPGRMESFARAFGSDVGNRTVLSQLQQAHQERTAKSEKMLQTKRDILEMKMNQEIERGKGQNALETLNEKARTDWELDNIKSRREAEEATGLEHERQLGRERLLEKRNKNAEGLLRMKLQAKLEEMKIDPRIILKIMDMEFQPLLAQFKARLGADPVLGENLTPEQQNDMLRFIQDAMPGIIKKGYVGGGVTPPPAVVKATKEKEQNAGKSKARLLYEQEHGKGN